MPATTDVSQLPDDVQARLRTLDELERAGGAARLEQLTAALTSMHVRTAARDALREAVPALAGDDLDVLTTQLETRLRAVEHEKKPGTFRVVVADPDDPRGERTDARGRPLAVRDAIDELRAHPTWSKLLGAPPAGGSMGRPGAEPAPASGARESGTALRTVQLTADEAKDPKVYARLKAQKQRGEIAGAVTPDGRPLV
jgi:hypothetical protein